MFTRYVLDILSKLEGAEYFSIMDPISPPVLWELRENMGWYSMAQVYPPSLTPLPWVHATPRSTPLSGRLGLRVSSVKLKTLNAFYGHFRSFAHPKPYIINDQRKKIYNPILIVFRY